MTAKELIEQLQKVAPDTEIIGGTWNGHVDTYTVIDRARVFLYDQVLQTSLARQERLTTG